MTAFSRMGDGRAVVRSTVREFLCSEAMDALGIPTTRALAMAAGDEPVLRETRRARRDRDPPGALVRALRLVRDLPLPPADAPRCKTLADYVIDRFYPECGAGEDRYARFFATVVERTARLMAAWQSVGFAHGVMNTDNFSILGLTLDYGPFGFLEAYEPGFICNHTDESGRYAFDRQPTIGLWNCYALAEALSSLIAKDALDAALARYEPATARRSCALHRAKLGLLDARDDDADLLLELFELLAARRVDWTRFWRALSHDDARRAGAAGRGRDLAGLVRALSRARRRRPARRRARGAPPCGRSTRSTCCATGSRRKRSRPARPATTAVVRALLAVAARALRRAPRARRVGPARSGEVCRTYRSAAPRRGSGALPRHGVDDETMSSDVQRPGEIRLLVRGIGRGVAITDVAELFAPFGVDPERIALPRDRRTRRRKGIAFVFVAERARSPTHAIKTLNETTFHEKPITVEIAAERPPPRRAAAAAPRAPAARAY